MLRLKIFRFFKMLSQHKDNLTVDDLSKYIDNANLINEILLKRDFQYLWRKSIKSHISNERYKISKVKLNKNKKHCSILLKINHFFTVTSFDKRKDSKEIIEIYVELFKNKKWKIKNIVNKEFQPELYQKLINNPTCSNDFFDNCSYWKLKIKNLDPIVISYLNIKKEFYRGNINDSYFDYDVNNAIAYARYYALKPNKSYKDFSEEGGDCTNFVSQCLHAGNLPLNNTWKPYTGTWIRVTELYYYLLRKSYGYEAKSMFDFQKGSIIQFFSRQKGYYTHSGIITEILPNGDCLYCCHSYNKLDFPLSEIYPYLYDKFRIIHITYKKNS